MTSYVDEICVVCPEVRRTTVLRYAGFPGRSAVDITLRFIGISPSRLAKTYCCLSPGLPNDLDGQIGKRLLDHAPFLHPLEWHVKARVLAVELEHLVAARAELADIR